MIVPLTPVGHVFMNYIGYELGSPCEYNFVRLIYRYMGEAIIVVGLEVRLP